MNAVHTLAKIRSFLSLTPGWSYGEGRPVSAACAGAAEQLLSAGHKIGFRESDAFPGFDGEVMVTFYRGNHCFEVTVEAADRFVFVHENDGEEVSEFVLHKPADVLARLQQEFRRAWLSSVSLISARTSMSNVDALSISPSNRQATTGAFRCLTNNALLPRLAAAALISTGTIATFPASQSSTGELSRPISRTELSYKPSLAIAAMGVTGT